jgi:hypothetical protein
MAALEQIGNRSARAALSRSIGRAAITVRKEARDIAAKEVNVAKRDINGVVNITRKPTASSLVGEVRIKNKAIALADYLGERQTKKGVTVKVSRRGGRKLIPRAFIATMKSGHRGIFWRKKGSGPTGLAGRLPIDELFAKTVMAALDTPEIINRLMLIARKRMAETMKQELKHRLTPKGK